jgi:DNA polymerase-3 subunit epsilon
MNTLLFDTETTGLVRDKLSPTHAKQPMPIQLGMKLDAINRREMLAANYLIVPDGWTMDAKASEVTGLNDDMAKEFGTHLITGVEFFLDMVKNADVIVAHNANFDITVMRRAAFVYAQMTGQTYVDPFEGKTMICTMLASLNIVKAPHKNGGKMRGEWKWPKLEECIRYFFNEELEGAHDALVDVRATARVYYELLDMGVFSGDYKFD